MQEFKILEIKKMITWAVQLFGILQIWNFRNLKIQNSVKLDIVEIKISEPWKSKV